MASWSVRSWHPNIYFEFCTSLSISSVGLCRFVKESWENSKACLFPGWPLRKFLFFIRRHRLCFSSRRSWQRLSEDFQRLSLDTAVWAIVPLLGWCLQRLVFHQFIMWYKGDESAVLYWTSCGLWASYSYLKTLCTISFSPLYLWESPQPSSKKGWFSSLGLYFAVFLPRHSFVKVLASGLPPRPQVSPFRALLWFLEDTLAFHGRPWKPLCDDGAVVQAPPSLHCHLKKWSYNFFADCPGKSQLPFLIGHSCKPCPSTLFLAVLH